MQLQPGRLNQSMLCMNIIDTTCACLRLHSAFGCANTNYIHIHTQPEPEYVYVYDVRLYVTIRALWTSSRKTSALFTFVSLYVMWCACLLDSIHGKRYVHFSNLILFFLSFSLSFFHFVALVRMRNAETAKAIFAHKIHAQHRHHISSVGVAILHKSSGGECERKIHTHTTRTHFKWTFGFCMWKYALGLERLARITDPPPHGNQYTVKLIAQIRTNLLL